MKQTVGAELFVQHDQGEFFKLRQCNAVRAPVVFARHQTDLIAEGQVADEFRIIGGAHDKSHVRLSVPHAVNDLDTSRLN